MITFENIYGELIIEVASYLNIHNKINLLSTCRKLRDLITATCLYEDLSIPRSRTNEMLERFESEELNGKQVKRLQIHINQIRELYLDLPEIFPRLQELIDKSYPANDPMIEPQEADLANFKGWKDTLVRYEVNKQYPHIMLTLEKFNFSQLTYLEMCFSLRLPPNGYGLDIVKCIQHAPNVKHITFHKTTVMLDMLEDIHANTPNLESIKFTQGAFVFFSGEKIKSLKKAPKIKTFHIGELVKIYDNGLNVLRYITGKYPNLENVDIHMVLGDGLTDDGNDEMERLLFNERDPNENPDEYEDDKEDNHRVVQSIFGDGAELNMLETEDDDYGDEFPLETYSPGTAKLYKEFMPLFILNSMVTLKSIRVETMMIFAFIPEVNPEDYNVTSMGFYRSIRRFDKSDNIEHLEFAHKLPKLEELFLEITRPQQVYGEKIYLPKIKKLEIYQRPTTLTTHDIDLHELMISYPNLEQLDIFTRNLSVFRGTLDEKISYPSLSKLKVEALEISPDVADFISESLPNIRYVSLKSCMEYEDFEVDKVVFDLPGATLDYFLFYAKNPELIYKVETEYDKRNFLVKESRHTGSVKEISDEQVMKTKDVLTVEIKCKRLLSLETANFPII